MVYVVGWFLLYLLLYLDSYAKGRYLRNTSIVILSIISLIPVLRGSTGTDTTSYLALIDKIGHSQAPTFVEPGFGLFVLISDYFGFTPELTIRVFAACFCLLLIVLVVTSNSRVRFYLLAYLLPLFFYNFSMNAIRLGMGWIILMYGVLWFLDGRKVLGISVALLALMFHYSLFIALLILIGFECLCKVSQLTPSPKIKLRRFAYVSITALFAAFLCLYVFRHYDLSIYFEAKTLDYSNSEAPSPYSGLRYLIQIVLLTFALLYFKQPKRVKINAFLVPLIFLLLGFSYSGGSYAFLRVIELVVLAYSLILLRLCTENSRFGYSAFGQAWIVAAGLIGSAITLREFFQAYGLGSSPFLPYQLL